MVEILTGSEKKGRAASDAYLIPVQVLQNDSIGASFTIEFSGTWVRVNYGNGNFRKFSQVIGTDEHSPLIESILREELAKKSIEELNQTRVFINKESDYIAKIFTNEVGILDLNRDPQNVAKENRFARELVLKELYNIQSSTGLSSLNQVIEKCHYYDFTIRHAIDALIDKRFIDQVQQNTIKLTYAGLIFVEDKLLSPFSDKIFLIAACNDEIYKLIDQVYQPAAKELGYELKFQERSEPKGSIHDDIWQYIRIRS
jgi:hypothetical protein